jgi:tetratricopeptide (TPR) repeat protein
MEKESASFWPNIKKYEDMLAKDPKSYCFTILSELYRKVGLLDDAINVANSGIKTHPDYVGGYMAAGRAYFEKGLKEEGKISLERVVRVTPDNLLAQKLLSQIYAEQGDISSAIKTLQVVELLNPEDAECRLMLESLEKASLSTDETISAEDNMLPPTEETDKSDDEFISADDKMETDPVEAPPGVVTSQESSDVAYRRDPLATATLAELYVTQGFLDRAICVYRELLETGPENERFKDRLKELENLVSGVTCQAEMPEPGVLFDDSPFVDGADRKDSCAEANDSVISSGGGDGIIPVLECWLHNINRGRYAAEGDSQKHR